MKIRPAWWLFISVCLMNRAWGTALYVDLNSPAPTPPYHTWATAATNIQDALDVSTNGDLVWVTNGVYASGGRRWFDSGTNRVTLTNAVTVQSVNGPAVTLIVGHQVAGSGAVLTNAARCVLMGSGAVLSGFTLTNGEGGTGNYPSGGGVIGISSTSPACTVTNCILINNLVTNEAGGGAYRVKLINCQLIGNSARYGGGACACSLVNCLVVSNNAWDGGGVYGNTTFGVSTLTNCTVAGNFAASGGGGVDNGGSGQMNNCIVYYNSSPNGSNYTGVKLAYCCTVPILSGDLTSFTNAPLFQNLAAGDFRLQSYSPCINAGANLYVGTTNDLAGQPRIVDGTVDVGAYEYPGHKAVVFYVDQNCLNPVAPFTNWATAATIIQNAINVATNGDLVLVTNGIYQTGFQNFVDNSNHQVSMTCRIVIADGITVASVNGPGVTIIKAAQSCVGMFGHSALNGFSLVNGNADYGGGVYCQTTNALVVNCILSSNTVTAGGGGAYSGTLNNCVVSNNVAGMGGGTYNSVLNNCLVTGNRAYSSGGGAFGGVLNHSVIVSNTLSGGGYGGAAACSNVLNNCLIIYNHGFLASPRVAMGSRLTQCTVCYNTNFNDDGPTTFTGCGLKDCILYRNGFSSYGSDSSYTNCCVDTPSLSYLPVAITGNGNLTNAPLFVNATNDFHLQPGSPCINSGNNAYVGWTNDLDGNSRIIGGTVDIGAYEFQSPGSVLSYAWAQQYGLPTDGSADTQDADGDGLNNWQEWKAGTNPTNALSVLKLMPPGPGLAAHAVVVTWQSAAGVVYYLQRNTGLTGPFSIIQSNLLGHAGTTSYTDASATNASAYFYRVGVQ